SIYGTTFRVDEGSNIAGEKSSLTKEKVDTLEKFANTRRNDAEVKSAGKAATLMLNLVTDAPKFHTTRRLYPHLVRIFIGMLREDTTGNTWGDRLPINGSFSHLLHLNYNEKAPIASVVRASYNVSLDRVAGTVTNTIPSFTPTAGLVPP